MTVEEVYADGRLFRSEELPTAGPESAEAPLSGRKPPGMLLTALALSNDARLDASGAVLGDPTEAALFNLAREKGFLREKLDEKFPRLAEIPFDSDRKLMTTFHPWENGRVISFTKGAVEEIVARSEKAFTHRGQEEIDRPPDPGDCRPNRRGRSEGPGVRPAGLGRPPGPADLGRSGNGAHADRDRRDDGPTPAGGAGGRGPLPVRRYPAGDDHRGPPADGQK